MIPSCTVIELLPDSLGKVQEWADYLRKHRAQALQSLEREGVTMETAFVVHIEGKDYLIGHMRFLEADKNISPAQEPKPSIDTYHQAFKKACWGKRYAGTLVSDLIRIPCDTDSASIGSANA